MNESRGHHGPEVRRQFLATDAQVGAVAERIAEDRAQGTALVVVVSARSDTTDALVRAASTISAVACPREIDQLLATGELAAAALLAIALREQGVPAIRTMSRIACPRDSPPLTNR